MYIVYLILIKIFVGPGETEDIPGIGQYEDFHTIDWQRDIARDRMRHRYILKRKQNSLIELVILYIIVNILNLNEINFLHYNLFR